MSVNPREHLFFFQNERSYLILSKVLKRLSTRIENMLLDFLTKKSQRMDTAKQYR